MESAVKRFFRIPVMLAAAMLLFLAVSTVRAEVAPAAVDVALAPGESIDIDKTVETPAIPPNPDICFLADSTGSMGPAIANVKANATNLMNTIVASQPTAQFCAAEYRDVGDAFLVRINQDVTASVPGVQTGINAWAASGGGDVKEGQIPALHDLANNASWRSGSSRVIVWFGDASGHDPRAGVSAAQAIAALQAANITVLAVPVDSGFGDGLNNGGQAAAITSATGGQVLPGATPDQLSDTILAGLGNLPITVTPVAVGCDPLNISWAPASQTVTSGTDANFTETIAVPADSALAGQTIVCTVEFRDDGGNVIGVQNVDVEIPLSLDASPDFAINELGVDLSHDVSALVNSSGVPLDGLSVNFNVVSGPNAGENGSDVSNASGSADFNYAGILGLDGLGIDSIEVCVTGADDTTVCETVQKEWVDTTLPAATCEDGDNPAGNEPQANTTNEDGFFVASAQDLVDPNVQIFIRDGDGVSTGSGHVFGPYSTGVAFKWTQAPGAPVKEKDGSGDVDWRLMGNGDPQVYAVDSNGNESDIAFCYVAPLPK